MASALAPSSSARETAAERPRALNVPVGLSPSSLTNNCEQPSAFPICREGSRCVAALSMTLGLLGHAVGEGGAVVRAHVGALYLEVPGIEGIVSQNGAL